MNLDDLLFEARNLSINNLRNIVDKNEEPVYVVVAGAVASGKSFVVNRDLDNVDVIDPDKYTMELGKGVYDGKNVAKSMAMVKKEVKRRLKNKETFLQQGTSANLQSTINKLKEAKKNGFKTVLLYIDTPVEQAIEQVQKRIDTGGRGSTITPEKVDRTSKGARLTFRALSGVDFEKADKKDLERVEKALEKTTKDLKKAQKYLDYYVRVNNKY